jgi:hypothetical protein
VDRIENVTLAWYNRPTPTDETLVRRSLRFRTGRGDDHEFTGIWAIRGAFINPQSTAAVNEASFSAAVSPAGACVGTISQSTVEVAIWPSQAAARSHVRYMNEGPRMAPEKMERIRNATLRWFCDPPKADEDAVRSALH